MIIVNPINMILSSAKLGIDIVLFFLTVRFLLSIRPFRLLTAFDKAGEQLVNITLGLISRSSMKVFKKDLSEKNKIGIAVMLLMSIDSLLAWVSVSVFQMR